MPESKIGDKVKVRLRDNPPRYGVIEELYGETLYDVTYHKDYRINDITSMPYFVRRELVGGTTITVLTDEEYDEAIILEKLTQST